MFQQVEVKHLQMDQTYKILANNYVFKAKFKGFRYVDEIREFEENPHLSLEFGKVHNISRGLHFIRTNMTPTRPIYQFVSKNPRWNMERRAVNKILRELIGDEYFEW
jgi:hypothetical protein